MKSSDTIGHSPVLCWYRGKTAGAREQNPRNIERGRQGVKNLAASVFFHTMGRGAEPQGLFSFHPVLPHCTRARRAGPIRVVPRASYADREALGRSCRGAAQGLPCEFATPSPVRVLSEK